MHPIFFPPYVHCSCSSRQVRSRPIDQTWSRVLSLIEMYESLSIYMCVPFFACGSSASRSLIKWRIRAVIPRDGSIRTRCLLRLSWTSFRSSDSRFFPAAASLFNAVLYTVDMLKQLKCTNVAISCASRRKKLNARDSELNPAWLSHVLTDTLSSIRQISVQNDIEHWAYVSMDET